MSNTPDNKNDTVALNHNKLSQTVQKTGHASQHSNIGPGSVLDGRYHIERSIGKGGMGEIFLAHDQKLQRAVAIKMMLSPESDTDNRRFQLESQTVASFTDPHTIRLFDYGITPQGFQYQVIEYLHGMNLKEHIRAHGPIHPTVSKSLGIQLCGSLAEAHRTNILHRDIKPSNIMLIDSPERGIQSKLLDFGLARAEHHDPTMTQTGTVLGSPMYMSPEQIENKSADLTPATDIYSLGLTLYTMLTGKVPFNGSSISSILAAQLFQQPPKLIDVQSSLQTEPGLCWIVETAIQKNAAERFVSVSQMKKAIELSLQEPTGILSLDDGELYFNDQAIQDYTAVSLQSISASLDAMTEHVDTDTILQSKSTINPKISNQTEEPAPKVFVGVVIAAFLLICVGIFWLMQPDITVTPSHTPTQIKSISPQPVTTTYSAIVNSTPEGATVTHGVETLGSTPWTGELPLDSNWEVVIQMDGYEPWKSTITSESSELNAILSPVKKTLKPSTPTKTSPPSNKSPKEKESIQKAAPSQDEVKQVTNPFKK